MRSLDRRTERGPGLSPLQGFDNSIKCERSLKRGPASAKGESRAGIRCVAKPILCRDHSLDMSVAHAVRDRCCVLAVEITEFRIGAHARSAQQEPHNKVEIFSDPQAFIIALSIAEEIAAQNRLQITQSRLVAVKHIGFGVLCGADPAWRPCQRTAQMGVRLARALLIEDEHIVGGDRSIVRFRLSD